MGEVEVCTTRNAGMSGPEVGQDVTYCSCALNALALVFMLKVYLFALALAKVMEERFKLVVEVEETMNGN